MIPRRSSRKIPMSTTASVTVEGGSNDQATDPNPPAKRPLNPTTTTETPNKRATASTSRSVAEEEMEKEEEEEEEEEENSEDSSSSDDEDSEDDVDPLAAAVNLVEPDLLDCPICTEPLRAPVFQCDNGHWACESCCKKVRNKCPSCSLPIGFNRNRAIERIVQSATASCANLEYGCMERLSYLNKLEHEKTCKYVPISCTSQGCNSTVSPKCFYKHVRKMHNGYASITLNTVNKICMKDQDHVILQAADMKLVFVVRRVVDRSLGSFINVCIAPTATDKRFSFDLTARKGKDSVSLKTAVELTPKYFVQPDKRKCLLIPKDFHSMDFDVDRYHKLDLEIVIRKVG